MYRVKKFEKHIKCLSQIDFIVFIEFIIQTFKWSFCRSLIVKRAYLNNVTKSNPNPVQSQSTPSTRKSMNTERLTEPKMTEMNVGCGCWQVAIFVWNIRRRWQWWSVTCRIWTCIETHMQNSQWSRGWFVMLVVIWCNWMRWDGFRSSSSHRFERLWPKQMSIKMVSLTLMSSHKSFLLTSELNIQYWICCTHWSFVLILPSFGFYPFRWRTQ